MARHALAALDRYGFVLAGGYAFHLHRITNRISQDVDLFTDRMPRAVVIDMTDGDQRHRSPAPITPGGLKSRKLCAVAI